MRRDLHPRSSIDWVHVQRLADVLRAGGELPPLLCDQNLRLIDGVHRLEAYKRVHATEVPVVIERGKDEGEFFAKAVAANVAHGRPFSPYEITMAAVKLRQDYGWSEERIAQLLVMPLDRLQQILIRRVARNSVNELVPLKAPFKVYAQKRINHEVEEAIKRSRGWEFWTPLTECLRQLADPQIRQSVIETAASDPFYVNEIEIAVKQLQQLLKDIRQYQREVKACATA